MCPATLDQTGRKLVVQDPQPSRLAQIARRRSAKDVESLGTPSLTSLARFIRGDLLQEAGFRCLTTIGRIDQELPAGVPVPSGEAKKNATLALDEMINLWRLPDRIVADVSGGVGFFLFGPGERQAWFCFENDGDISLVLRRQRRGEVEAEDVADEAALLKACKRAVEFLKG